MPREFTATKATRTRVPLLIGLYGPSGGGKTKSALRLCDGMKRVDGGETYVIDTEAKRALHYAKEHDFKHVPFLAPFGPADYLEAFNFCIRAGASRIVIDSASHLWEGVGGVLEMHADEHQRMGGKDSMNFTAWIKPKRELKRFVDALLQMECNFVFCFRAREKLKIVRGEQPEQLGWMPVGDDSISYEMTVNALLPPGADGVPQWKSKMPGEQVMRKLPGHFRELLTSGKPFDEDMGEQLARWAAGDAAPAMRLHFNANWGNKVWAGKPISDAPAPVVAEYIGALEKAKRPLPDGLTELYDEMVAAEMDRVQRESSPPPAADEAGLAAP